MIKDVLQSIVGIDIYPIISLVIFLIAFAGITVWALMQDKSKIHEMSHLPLERADADRLNEMGA